MKTKSFLAVIGLLTTHTFFYSCHENSIDVVNDPVASTVPNVSKLNSIEVSNLIVGGNYFEEPEPFTNAVDFMKSHIVAQGPAYVLTQDDLNMFYDKAQIPVNNRMSLSQVNEITTKTLDLMQLSIQEAVQQLNVSNQAKPLIVKIHTASIPDLNNNLAFDSLPDNEKFLIKNLNDYKRMWENGNLLSRQMSSAEIGGYIGAAIGFTIGLCCPPAGWAFGLVGGAFLGVLIGSGK